MIMSSISGLKLTQTVQKGGCAAKVAASELRKILGQVHFPPKDKNVLVDGGLFDDAAIYRVSEDLALVQTLDFFTPIVDTPEIFGRVAAANALSDVYAMGGLPKTAMAILAFPISTLDAEVAVAVLQGASDILKEAGVNFVGGHSIDDDSLKFGLSVTGYVHPKEIWSNAGAKTGDKLILTKRIGTGTLAAALKKGVVSEDEISDALVSMSQLNKVPALLSSELRASVHAATDITGFGLLGHALQMANASQKSFSLTASQIPFFAKAPVMLESGHLTKAHRTNREYSSLQVRFGDGISELQKLLFVDPQTSGGLLLSVSADKAEDFLRVLQNEFPYTAVVGEVLPRGPLALEVQ
jgi:selenide,water dikinase